MYFDINWAHIQSCYSFQHNDRQLEWSGFDENLLEGLFLPFFYGTVMILAGIAVFGVVFEVLRRRKRRRNFDDYTNGKERTLHG